MTAAWINDAACRGKPIDWFYPDAEAGQAHPEAKALCKECPVRAECLGAALYRDDGHGLWGGLSPGARRVEQHRRDVAQRRVA
jgi:WhiB family redox-sensing transcriptional regulator